jgi:hypothetical protein
MKASVCNLNHRIRRELVVNNQSVVIFQCCDSRECLFKSSKAGMTVCLYDDVPVDEMMGTSANEHTDGTKTDHE